MGDPDISFKYIAFLVGMIVVPLIVLGVVIPMIPSSRKTTAPVTATVSTTEEKATAVLTFTKGDVQIQKNQGWATAKSDDYLYQSDGIKTGANSQATILFGSGSIVRVDQNSLIALTDYRQEGDNWIIRINQIFGRTWNRVQKLIGASVYEVNTPTAVATVRGTIFAIDADASQSAVIVDEGTVGAKLVDPKNPERKIVQEIKIERQQMLEVNRQKIEEVRIAIAENRPPVVAIVPKKIEKMPEWVEVHKRETEREQPRIEEVKKREQENRELRRFMTPLPVRENTRLPETENRTEIKSTPTPTPFTFTNTTDKFTPVPTPTITTDIKNILTTPTPTPATSSRLDVGTSVGTSTPTPRTEITPTPTPTISTISPNSGGTYHAPTPIPTTTSTNYPTGTTQ